MIDEDLYFTERLMREHVRKAHHEAETFRLWQESKAGSQGWLVRKGLQVYRQSGSALQRLGAWLEQLGLPGDEALDDQLSVTS